METINVDRFLKKFNQLSKPEQLAIADKISEQTFNSQWSRLDAELPDLEISEEDIMEEVRAVRYDNKKA